MTKTLNSVYFIRHGETDYNKADLFTGSTDVALNNVGRIQAQDAAKKLSSFNIEEIWTSPLIRAKETAEIISANLNLPVVTFSVMAERHFGRLEGKLKNSVDRKTLPDDAENEVWIFIKGLKKFYPLFVKEIKISSLFHTQEYLKEFREFLITMKMLS